MPDSRWKLVSIRTLCGEGDGRRGKAERHQFQHFYPRPPRGGRPTIRRWTMPSGQFLSTPSARRATCAVTAFRKQLQIISIHALREEGDGAPHPAGARTQHFYPRPPRGGRPSRCCGTRSSTRFLSTPSARRATCWPPPPCLRPVISIHALREEGDKTIASFRRNVLDFYPRPPRGGRHGRAGGVLLLDLFLSTPSARRATRPPMPQGSSASYFYPRPPRGGRRTSRRPTTAQANFYPRPPRGGRPTLTMLLLLSLDFYPRPPRGGRHRVHQPHDAAGPISIHALREEGDPFGWRLRRHPYQISIHALREEGDEI